MQRWTAAAVGALMLVLIGALVLKGGRRSFITEAPRSDAGAETSVDDRAATERAAGDAGVLEDLLLAGNWDPDGGMALAHPADAEAAMLVPSGLPKAVRFGVILVQYRGAQAAPASSRSKDDARVLAHSLVEGARADFKAQVSKGDPGSMEDAGRIPRGVLEPSTEVVLFTLGAGSVSDPIDTPRGFWIVKRIE